jgi:hypothetical protein
MKHLITCLALGIACAAGAQVNEFEPPYNPDSNADAFIGTHDLMDLLSAFGSAFEPENIYVSSDSMHMIVKSESFSTYAGCDGMCRGMGNQWRMASSSDLMIHGFEWTSNIEAAHGEGAWCFEPEWVSSRIEANSNNWDALTFPTLMWSGGITFKPNSPPMSQYDGSLHGGSYCVCATQERPKVEYSFCEGTNIQSCADAKVADGWYPLGSPSTMAYNGWHKTQAFWRWAE